MQKYTHIMDIQHVAESVKILNGIDQRYSFTVTYLGTVKLHGCNVGVRVTPDGQVSGVQSRNTIITPEDDFKGIAKFVESRKAVFIEIAQSFNVKEDITIYGEWIGPGVVKRNFVGICELPEKQFVIFGASVDCVGDHPDYFHEEGILATKDYSEYRIYFIGEAPTCGLIVDFLDEASLQAAVKKVTALTAQVEAKCPWAAKFGIDGLGEGIVWKPVGRGAGDPVLYFKSKGDKHSVVKVREKPTIAPEVLSSIAEFVEYAVTENRLDQGLEALEELGHPLEPKSTGKFIQWVIADVKKECSLEMERSKLDWKQVSKSVTTKAREFWQRKI